VDQKKNPLKMYRSPLLITFLLFMLGCSPSSQPIQYGSDMCHFCKMTVVDRQHAAEAVTSKGKVYTFDAVECLLGFLANEEGVTFAYLLVNDYMAPGELVDAASCTYLISPAIPSPMGENLSAFSDPAAATELQAAKGGELLDWEALRTRFLKNGMKTTPAQP
jgi:copper chaperone NosL